MRGNDQFPRLASMQQATEPSEPLRIPSGHIWAFSDGPGSTQMQL